MGFVGSVIDFPIRVDNRGTIVVQPNESLIITEAISDILETRRGERPMLPDYGIEDFVFAVQDSSFATRLAYVFQEQIQKYIPLVQSVIAKATTDDKGRAIVTVRYVETSNINAPRNLVFPVWQYQGATSI